MRATTVLSRRVDRRTLLRSVVGAAVAPTGLAGCTADSHGDTTIQLSWLKNVQFAGEYFAATRGYYRAAGFSGVRLVSGGTGTSAEKEVAAGRAFCGISSPTVTAPAIVRGAPLTILGATYQKNPFCMVSLAQRPIPSPEAMAGRRIGVQADRNQVIFPELLRANGMTMSDVHVVTVGYDVSALTTGKVDGFMGFVTNEPTVLRSQGFEPVTFLLADHGLPFVSETYTVRRDSLRREREKCKALLLTQVRGWRDAVTSPGAAARLAVDRFGKGLGLDLAQQVAEARAQNDLVATPGSRRDGLLTLSGSMRESNIEVLRRIGVRITSEELFDLSVLEEVYDEHPDLRSMP